MRISISPRRITVILTFVVVCLTLAGIGASVSTHISVDDYLMMEMRESYVRLFTLDGEANIPMWYASSTLLLSSILLGTIAYAKKTVGDRYVLHWIALSIIFLLLSLDEAAIIHEMAIKPLRFTLNTSGFLYYAWIIPGITFVFIIALFYLRFLADLPPDTRGLFLLAGVIFVGGAIGVESISGRHVALYGEKDITYKIIITAEEFLEMLGIVVFIYALLSYLGSQFKDVRILISGEATK